MNLQNFKINVKGFCLKVASPAQLLLGCNCDLFENSMVH